jgi:hypothetical protein
VAIALSGTEKARITKIFNDLAAGGQLKGPLTAQPGGSEVGWRDGQIRHQLDGHDRQGLARLAVGLW